MSSIDGVWRPVRPGVAASWLAVAVAAYAVAVVVLRPVIGFGVMALVVVPAGLGGWFFGLRGGLAISVALALVDTGLLAAAPDHSGWLLAFAPSSLPGTLAMAGIAVGVGAFRERHVELMATRSQLREELAEREALSAALGASEVRFRLLAEEALTGVYLIQDGVFQYVNRAFAATFGYEPMEIIGRVSPEDLTLVEDWPLVRANIEERLERGVGAAHYRFRGRRKDGSSVPVEVLGRALEVDGRPAILGTLRDLTKEAADEAQLQVRLTALEAASVGIVVTDSEGVIEWANPHAVAMTGYAMADLEGAPTRLFNSESQDESFYAEMWGAVQAGRTWRGELVNRRRNGEEYPEQMSITPVLGRDGVVEHYVAVKQDISERRAAERSIQELNANLSMQLARVSALHDIDVAITRGTGLDDALDAYLTAARQGLGVDAVAVFLATEDGEALELRGTRGFRVAPKRFRLPLERGVAGRAVAAGEPVVVRGRERILEALVMEANASLPAEEFEVFLAAPLRARGAVRGALVGAHRSDLEVSEDWLDFVAGVATQGAILVDNANLVRDLKARNEELRAAYDATIEGWSRALDLRDKETEGHSQRVTELTLRLARAMGFPEEELVNVRWGALLHDIGKMGVPDAILQKPGKLTDGEWDVMRQHTVFARDLLAPIAFLRSALAIPYSHHERWDGTGYPEGLHGEDIPLAARIFAVADVFDALTSDRPYRQAWSREATIAHIREGAGSHFDPQVVAVFLAVQDDLPV